MYVIDEKLGKEGVQLFRGIFDKNTQDQIKQFFNEPIIRLLWPGIIKYFTEDVYSQSKDGTNNDIVTYSSIYLNETNCKISKQFDEIF